MNVNLRRHTYIIQTGIFIILLITFSACGADKEKSTLHLNKGIELIYKARHQEALQELNLAVQYNSASHEAFYYRGACKRNLNDVEGAMSDYKKAVELNPDFADAHFSLGQLYDFLNDHKMACYYYLKAEALGRPNTNEYTRWCK